MNREKVGSPRQAPEGRARERRPMKPTFSFLLIWGGDIVEILELFNDVTSLISNVGFPIFCCIMMFKSMEKQREDHKEESAKWVEALNNNTNVMKKLVEKLEGTK